ncbi:MAG: hypothetical protein JWP52_3417 [Rhizobacter sp.]|nr:hypothetical protein [Rhizobacter sp.]
MGKQLSEYQKQHAGIDTRLADLTPKFVSSARSIQNIEAMFPQAIEAIGDRVQELKTGGAKGTTLADYKADAEVQTCLKLLTGLNALGSQYETVLQFKKLAEKIDKDRTELSKSIAEEIAALEKKKDAALPGFKKLHAEVKNLAMSQSWGTVIDELMMAKKEKYDLKAVEKANLLKVQQAIAAAKAGPVKKKDMAFDEAKANLQVQHASAQVAKAHGIKDKLETACTDALKEGDVAKAKVHLVKATSLRDELRTMVATNKEAVKVYAPDVANATVKKILAHFKSTEDVLKAAEAVLAQAVKTALRPRTPTKA